MRFQKTDGEGQRKKEKTEKEKKKKKKTVHATPHTSPTVATIIMQTVIIIIIIIIIINCGGRLLQDSGLAESCQPNLVCFLFFPVFSLVFFCLVSKAPSINQHYVTWAAYATECIQVSILYRFFPCLSSLLKYLRQ